MRILCFLIWNLHPVLVQKQQNAAGDKKATKTVARGYSSEWLIEDIYVIWGHQGWLKPDSELLLQREAQGQ